MAGKSKAQIAREEKVDRSDIDDLRIKYEPEMARCAGGRMVYPYAPCIHCGSESPDEECKRPMSEASKPWKIPNIEL